MNKSELKQMIRELLTEELNRINLTESAEGGYYVIKAWAEPGQKAGTPAFDSAKKGTKYATYDDVLAALKTSELDELGAYEITWIKSGEK
jgi:hypothetical protein